MATSTSKMKLKNISIPIFLIVHLLLSFSWIILDSIVFVPDIHRLIFLIFIEALFVVIYLKTVIGNLIEKIVMMVIGMVLLVFSYFYYDSILMYTTLFNDSEVTYAYDECLEITEITDNYPPEEYVAGYKSADITIKYKEYETQIILSGEEKKAFYENECSCLKVKMSSSPLGFYYVNFSEDYSIEPYKK